MTGTSSRADRPMVTLPPEPAALIAERPEPGSEETLVKHKDWLYGDQPEPCRCDHAWKPLGMLHGVSMGHGWVRMNTHPNCLHHSKCHGFTDTLRAKGPKWWGKHLYCPVHKTKNCPKRTTYRVRVPVGSAAPDAGGPS